MSKIEKGNLAELIKKTPEDAEGISSPASSSDALYVGKDKRLIQLLQISEEDIANIIKNATGWERGNGGDWLYNEADDADLYLNAKTESAAEYRRRMQRQKAEQGVRVSPSEYAIIGSSLMSKYGNKKAKEAVVYTANNYYICDYLGEGEFKIWKKYEIEERDDRGTAGDISGRPGYNGRVHERNRVAQREHRLRSGSVGELEQDGGNGRLVHGMGAQPSGRRGPDLGGDNQGGVQDNRRISGAVGHEPLGDEPEDDTPVKHSVGDPDRMKARETGERMVSDAAHRMGLSLGAGAPRHESEERRYVRVRSA